LVLAVRIHDPDVILGQVLAINFATNPNQRQAIADISGNPFGRIVYVILQADGRPVGSIFTDNLQLNRFLVPGALASWRSGNGVIVGGTGAFLGARGQAGTAFVLRPGITPARGTSVTEDPANRRIHGGDRIRSSFISSRCHGRKLRRLPMARP